MACALVIPVCPRHYHYIYTVLEKANNALDLHLIFTNQEDYMAFEAKDRIHPIILPECVRTDNIVTYKKFYALQHHLQTNTAYEYFIVCDAEIDIVANNFNHAHIAAKCKEIFDKRVVYGGTITDSRVRRIITDSASLVKGDHSCIDTSIYTWWSDLPVYKRDTLEHFFQLIDYANLSWFHFDHIVYQSYLVMYHGFKTCNVSSFINLKWSLESYVAPNMTELTILKNLGYGFAWVSPYLFKKYDAFLIEAGAVILYHMDRRYG